MVLVPYDTTIMPDNRYVPPAKPEEAGGFFSAFGASFERENDVWAAARLLTRDEPLPDMKFDFDAYAKESRMFQQNPEVFYKARSRPEFQQLEAQVAHEMQLARDMQASGLGATLGGLVGAILSPTTLIPGGAIYRGAKMARILKSSASVAAAAAGATLLQEGVLQAESVTRTKEESAVNTLFALALGGMIGGAVAGLSKGQIGKLREGMALGPEREAIHIPGVTPTVADELSPAGAQITPEELRNPSNLGDIKGIAPSLPGMEGALSRMNPVSRSLANEHSPTVRNLAGSIDSGGLYTEGLTNLGGDVASRSKQWLALSFNALRKRAEIMGGNAVTRFLGARDFAVQTAFAMRRGGVHENPAVMAYAKYMRDEVYTKLLNEAKSVGMKGFDNLDDEYVLRYVNRMARKKLIAKDHDEFTDILKEHFTEVLTEKWQNAMTRVEDANVRDSELADDLSMDKAQVAERRAQLETEIASLPQRFSEEVRVVAEDIRALRAEAKTLPKAEAKLLRDEAALLEKQNEEALAPFRKEERKLKGKFARLGRTASGLASKQQIALQQIEALQEAADASRGKLVRRINKIMSQMDRWDDAKLDGELNKLEEELQRNYAVWERGEEKIAKMEEVPEGFEELVFNDVRATDKVSRLKEQQAARKEKLDAMLEKLDEAQSLDREGKRLAVEDVAKQVAADAEQAVVKRAKQQELLKEKIAAADPARAAEEAKQLRSKAQGRTDALYERLAALNIKGKLGESPDVSSPAKELANYIALQYMGNTHHMPFLSVLKERGPEIARMLHIDETRTWGNGRRFEEFLENDSEYLMRSYVRTMAADIEMLRKFQTLNPLAPDSPYLRQITDEFDTVRATARAEATASITKGTDKAKVGKVLDKKLEAIAKSQQTAIEDLHGLVDRVRHVRGIPENAESIGYRLGKIARNLNTVRLMGNMMITSLADMAALVVKHGFLSSFSDGLIPFVNNMKAWKANAQEVQDAGTALDLILHGRAAALADVMDEVRGGTMAERGLQFATNHMGAVTMMDRWNSGMKQVAGVMTIAKISRSLEAVATQAGSPAAVKGSRYLERLGIDEGYARMLWNEFQTSGDRVNGMMLPNTENWGRTAQATRDAAEAKLIPLSERLAETQQAQKKAFRKYQSAKKKADELTERTTPEVRQRVTDAAAEAKADLDTAVAEHTTARDAHAKAAADADGKSATFAQADELRKILRGAIVRETDDIVITPGAERPLWMDGSETGRLLAQFRSFTFSSTQKIIWAGAQDLRSGELAPLGGLVFSVALGTLSYYIKQKAKGGKAATEVDNASPEKLLIEGIKASLVLGVLAEGQSFMEDIPGPVSGIATLGTGPEKRTPFGGAVAGMAGPTVGLIRDLDNVLAGTLSGELKDGDISSLRRLMPYNNVFWATRAFTAVEEGLKK